MPNASWPTASLTVETKTSGLRVARLFAWLAGWAAGRVRVRYRIGTGEWRELAGVTVVAKLTPFERSPEG